MLPMSEDRRRPERLLRRHQQRPRARARPYPRLRPRPTSRLDSLLSLPITAGDTDASASADLSAIICASIESSGDSDLFKYLTISNWMTQLLNLLVFNNLMEDY